MIREDLLDFQYYLNRLSKFMQESYGINEQVETFYSLLKQANDFYDEFLKEANIFNSYNVYSGYNLLIDKLGAIFGCYRSFTIPQYDPINWGQIIGYISINLDDHDFLIYIKCQIIKQNFNGTRNELQELYSTYQDGVYKEGILDLIFYYITHAGASAECYIYWDAPEGKYSNDLKNLFLNGFLTIESLGILYHRAAVNISNFENFVPIDNNGNPINPQINNYFAYDGYNLLTSEPADWSTDYTRYYTIVATGVTPGSNPDWEEDKFYELIDGNYVLLLVKPYDWANIYDNFYTIVVTGNTSSTYSANTYYEHVELGGIFA